MQLSRLLPETILILIMKFILGAVAAAAEQPIPSDLSITVNSDNGSVTGAKVNLAEADVGNGPVGKLLKQHGIAADNEAFSALYELNPNIRFDKINPGTKVLLPVVTGDDGSAFTNSGQLFQLAVQKEAKQHLADNASSLIALVSDISALNKGSFSNDVSEEALKKKLTHSIALLQGASRIANENSIPVSPQMLRQMAGESQQLCAMAKEVVAGQHRFTKQDGLIIDAISESMDARALSLSLHAGPTNQPPQWRTSLVKVRLLDSRTQNAVNGYRVYYVAAGLSRVADQFKEAFPRVTSPTQDFLTEANYLIWAEQGTPNGQVTSKVPLKVREQQNGAPQLLDLSL